MQEILGCLEEFSILILQRVKENSSFLEIMILWLFNNAARVCWVVFQCMLRKLNIVNQNDEYKLLDASMRIL